ncbi:MAG TPA: 16S rRNA (cytosine(1402)-N(4))-methyltransferase RsmH [Syntrophales bacterium]|jgi:16S rRNA (cytosine1402-N4)-methyltransferase|nr:16S rRNA (cytosine(1402)-N(4))-methyltransferase RsmH [Syntrophales bacterium]HON22178.1 16S rRNA (cytosine(1402)-N(4))-methyltransferase RsmH [Syntrophales bacterium]HOU77386.1 16S rRNA (cytosine(1402)-N(4))-methyltransferase RsmH [Syntrophales bacterium]HPC32492.1 16S rRNA (cytosine(1402)-N(4))-methyltransferase RsmH [Syntrophales bacterium]HQG34113.1 16S rRNA (cytosine(1402)-N(4))-methyltransferase RsmH [Syntrophales bacterium]
MHAYHQPVLLQEAVASLGCRTGGIYVDGTLGGAGHAFEILERSSPDGLLIGIDADADALQAAVKRLLPFHARVRLVRGNFAAIGDILLNLNIDRVDGILLDLGVSSHQLDVAERGFSFSQEALLDMRMDTRRPISAHTLVNTCPDSTLEKIIREYGEEPRARRIARAIVEARRGKPIVSTTELAAIITAALPRGAAGRRLHPATRTFQALRIAVNEELSNLDSALRAGIDLLNAGGRFSVISYHSLEDRLVKTAFRDFEGLCSCPPGLPVCQCGRRPKARPVYRRPVTPSPAEIAANPRSRSAKLRTAERI